MREVSRDDFFKVIGPLNCHPQIQGNWPYTCLWKMLDYHEQGRIVGKTVDYLPEGKALTATKYFLA